MDVVQCSTTNSLAMVLRSVEQSYIDESITQDDKLAISIPTERRQMVETAFHLALLAILTASHKARTPVMDFCGPVADGEKSDCPILPRVLDIALHLADTAQTEPSMVHSKQRCLCIDV